MPWYIPIITAFIGLIGGIVIRAIFDKKADKSTTKREESKSREALRREIFNDYMTMTDAGEYRPYALQRAGSLRLTKDEFAILLEDISRTGRQPFIDENDHDLDYIPGLGLFETLLLVSSQKREARSPREIYDAVVQAIEDISPPLQMQSTEEGQPR
ncbi:hypothetical protein [Luteolibacter sp. AS25]|uniref:hypothetical protein n=1 Tax=Luteolibacter sp. AS25 TaxID=3135776 RepID=UPI00398AA967